MRLSAGRDRRSPQTVTGTRFDTSVPKHRVCVVVSGESPGRTLLRAGERPHLPNHTEREHSQVVGLAVTASLDVWTVLTENPVPREPRCPARGGLWGGGRAGLPSPPPWCGQTPVAPAARLPACSPRFLTRSPDFS